MSTDWIKELKPGDDVIIRTRSAEIVSSVTRRTPSGRVMVAGAGSGSERAFTSDGKEIGGLRDYEGVARLKEATPDNVRAVKDRNDRERLISRFVSMSWSVWGSVPLETLRAVRDLLAAAKGEKS